MKFGACPQGNDANNLTRIINIIRAASHDEMAVLFLMAFSVQIALKRERKKEGPPSTCKSASATWFSAFHKRRYVFLGFFCFFLGVFFVFCPCYR